MDLVTPSNDFLHSALESLFQTKRVDLGQSPLIQTPLLDCQTVAVAYHYLTRRSLINYPVGAGKTKLAIASAMLMRERDDISKILVAVQPSQLGYWADEIQTETFIRPHVIFGTKTSRQKKIAKMDKSIFTVAYYPTIFRDIEEYCKHYYDLLIMDEATVVKNRETQIAHAMKAIAKRSKSVMLLTATPLQNNVTELFSLMELLNPNAFGDYSDFVRSCCIEERFHIKRRGRIFTVTKITGTKPEKVPEIIDKIKFNILTRSREDLEMELPPIVYEDRWLDMTGVQWNKYREVENGVLTQGNTLKYVELLAKFVYQLQICDSAQLVDPGTTDPSPKIEELRRLINGEYAGEKIVVFSMFKKTIKLIQDALEKDGVSYVKITGDEKVLTEREQIRRRFADDPSIRLMLITTAAEMGVNLQAAGVMIIVSRLFNPQRMKQVVGRIYRQGQKRHSVVIINLLMKDTIETKVLAILKKKAELYEAIFGRGKDIAFKHDMLKRLIAGQPLDLFDSGDSVDYSSGSQFSTPDENETVAPE